MTRPTIPRTPPLYHGAAATKASLVAASWSSTSATPASVPAALATLAVATALTAFYLVGSLQTPGPLQLMTAHLTLGAVAFACALAAAQRELLLTPAAAWGPAPRAAALLGLRAPRLGALLGAVLIGASAWYANLALAELVSRYTDAPLRVDSLERAIAAPSLSVTLLSLAVVPGLCEELAFRGLWARGLATRFGPLLAALISAVGFGAYHLTLAQLVPTTMLGLVLGWTSLRADSVWIAVTIHVVNNAVAIVAARTALGSFGIWLGDHRALGLALALTLTTVGLLLIEWRRAVSRRGVTART